VKFRVPINDVEFEIPDEWLKDAGLESFRPTSDHYVTNMLACTATVAIEEVEPPLRKEGEFWFRNRESVVNVLSKIVAGEGLAPIEVWSKEKKKSKRYIVRDGFHRYYASIVAGFPKIPISVNDFNLNEFLEEEQKGEI
jgi:hypothetical protein